MSHGHAVGLYLRTRAVGPQIICAMLRAVDAVEPDAFRVLGVQDFDGVAVEDSNDLPTEVGRTQFWKEQDYYCCKKDEGNQFFKSSLNHCAGTGG